MENREKTEYSPAEKAAMVPLLRVADQSKGCKWKRQKAQMLEMFIISNKDQLCFVEAFLLTLQVTNNLAFILWFWS